MKGRKKTELPIYPDLEMAMSCKTYQDIAEAVGINVRTLAFKRAGAHEWKLGEMLAIRDLLAPDMTLDELFRREEREKSGGAKMDKEADG